MEVTAESNSQFLAFRRFVYGLSKQLSKDDAGAIAFLYLKDLKQQQASALEVLCKLEADGVIAYSKADRLMEVMKDIRRPDLANEVKDYLKARRQKAVKKGRKQKADDNSSDVESEGDLILRATLEAAQVQSTVLLQHMEMLQNCLSAGTLNRTKIREAIVEAAQTSEALAERLRRAETEVNRDHDGNSSEGGGSDQSMDKKGYINTFHSGEFLHLILLSWKLPHCFCFLWDFLLYIHHAIG